MVDIVIGIPSYNEEKNIKFVTRQIALGLNKYFKNSSCLIINIDNHSIDRTRQEFLNTNTLNIPKIYISTEPNVMGKGNNLFNLFCFVKGLEPKAIATIDADLKSISPLWIKELIQPILDGFDFVTPNYLRDKNDATITNHFIYPIMLGLFNKNIRQPIGGDFAFSTRLVEYWLNQEWNEEIKHFGIDVFMTTNALLGNFKITSANLGVKIHKVKEPSRDLSPMFYQVLTTFFDILSKSGKLDRLKSIQYIEDSWEKTLYNLLVRYKKVNDKKTFIESIKSTYLDKVSDFKEKTRFLTSEDVEKEVINQAKAFRKLVIGNN